MRHISKTTLCTIATIVLVPAIIFLLANPVIIVGAVYTLQETFTQNHAKDLAAPIEKSLINDGATKVCSESRAGVGMDSLVPSYVGYFQFNVGKDQTLDIVRRAVEANGYKLMPYVPTQNEVVDSSVLNFTDSKPHTYTDLMDGDIKLWVSLNTNTSTTSLSCKDGFKTVKLQGDTHHTVVSIGVRLPERKASK